MKKISIKNKKLLIGSLTALASFGAIGGVALSLDSKLTQKYNTTVNSSNNDFVIKDADTVNLPQAPVSNGNVTIGGTTSDEVVDQSALGMKLTRIANSSRSEEYSYKIQLINNEQKEGTIYFVTDSGITTDEVTFKPGDEIKLLFEPNRGFEGFTVREFKITGANKNYYVPTKNDETNKRQFIATMPKYEDTIDKLTGESWLYSKDGQPITINPSFIIADIGQNGQTVEWQHGTFMNVGNGYVYNLDKDTKFSEILTKYETFKNDNIENPIDLYFYLNGHKLILDTNLSLEQAEKYAPSGWNLAFYNNGTDSATDGKYGSIVLDSNFNGDWTNGNIGRLEFKGSMTFGRSVNYKYAQLATGLQFLDDATSSSIKGVIENEIK